MSLNRLYNFTPGQIIQSSQVNGEFDQLVSAVNNYCIDAQFSSHNTVSDGSIVDAISALDAMMSPLAYNYSKAIVIEKASTGKVRISASSGKKAIFARDQDIYIEDGVKEVSASTAGVGQFVDIFLTEDIGDSPAISGSKPIALVAKSSGTAPYDTTASAGEYMVGSCYVTTEGKVLSVHSLENPYAPVHYFANWDQNEPFNFIIDSTGTSYANDKPILIPVFVPSHISYAISMYLHTSQACDSWNYEIYVKRNTVIDNIIKERVPPLNPSSNVGRIHPTLIDSAETVVNPGIYTFLLGGKQAGDDVYKAIFNLYEVYSQFKVVPSACSFDTRNP